MISEKLIKDNEIDQQFDIYSKFALIFRNKNFILILTGIAIILSGIYGFTKKKVWKGQFQIVISQNDPTSNPLLKKSISSQNPGLTSLGLFEKDDLRTEIEILKSPSVLLPVYNYVKDHKEKKGEEFNEKYKAWVKNNLEINLEKGTKVLNLAYMDSEKEFIKPLLNKISNTYQDYSRRNTRKSISDGIAYLEEQIKNYQEKSDSSSKKLTSFTYKYDIKEVRALNEKNQSGKYLPGELIKAIESELKLFKEDFDINPETIIGAARSVASLRNLTSRYDELSNTISYKKTIFVENDKSIKDLENRKKFLIENIKQTYINYLEAKKLKLESEKEASRKKLDVLQKFEKLNRDARQDFLVLNELEKSFRTLSLQKAKSINPWELITQPTLQTFPVSPSKKKIVGLGLLFGLSLGILISYFKEKKSDIIYQISDIHKLVKYQIIETFKISNTSNWEESIYLFANGNLLTSITEISIINIDVEKQNIDLFMEKFDDFSKDKRITVNSNLLSLKKDCNVILALEIGKTKKEKLLELKNKLDLQGGTILGLFIFTS